MPRDGACQRVINAAQHHVQQSVRDFDGFIARPVLFPQGRAARQHVVDAELEVELPSQRLATSIGQAPL